MEMGYGETEYGDKAEVNFLLFSAELWKNYVFS